MTSPRVRAGHTDRQAAVDRLSEHFTEGRLDAAEFDERIGTAYAATYLDELPALFADLPELRPQQQRFAPGARWAYPDGGPVGPGAGPNGPAGGYPPGSRRGRPPRIFGLIAILMVLAVIISIGALSHGFFPFPLLWIGLIVLFLAKGADRRRRWAQHGGYGGYDAYGHRR